MKERVNKISNTDIAFSHIDFAKVAHRGEKMVGDPRLIVCSYYSGYSEWRLFLPR